MINISETNSKEFFRHKTFYKSEIKSVSKRKANILVVLNTIILMNYQYFSIMPYSCIIEKLS